MSIMVNIKDPRSCRLAKLMKAISEYVENSGNGEVSLDMELQWHPKKEAES